MEVALKRVGGAIEVLGVLRDLYLHFMLLVAGALNHTKYYLLKGMV